MLLSYSSIPGLVWDKRFLCFSIEFDACRIVDIVHLWALPIQKINFFLYNLDAERVADGGKQ